MLSELNDNWLGSFIEKNGYKPRVLHIGNIANNAYNNAKLLNQVGLDCDVICHSYFHIMGYPEWEDADLKSTPIAHFEPEWFDLDYGEFMRPDWFAQGHEDECIEYLLAKRKRKFTKKAILWNVLLDQSKIVRSSSVFQQIILRMLMISWRTKVLSLKIKLEKKLRSWRSKSKILMQNLVMKKILRKFNKKLSGVAILDGLNKLIKFFLRKLWHISRWLFHNSNKHTPSFRFDYDNFINLYLTEFGDRHDLLTKQDFAFYLPNLNRWRALINEYDIVIGYATDPIRLLLLGKPYFAFEHGTIREIPYEHTSRGRLTALSYRKAKHVFVTNTDCITSAEYLAPGRFTPISHPYDEDHGMNVKDVAQFREKLLLELECDVLLFHPTRQDWVKDGRGFADKGNDLFLKAFGEARKRGFKVGLVCCDWGANVDQSKELIAELDCQKYVKWVPPMALVPFERMCLASDIVVDQFILGAFGGVFFKAMSLGVPIMSYLDEEAVKAHYPVCPPVINCRRTEEILQKIEQLVSGPAQLKKLGNLGRDWIKEFHSKRETVNLQIDQFRILLDAKND